jgi:hypothetical protein
MKRLIRKMGISAVIATAGFFSFIGASSLGAGSLPLVRNNLLDDTPVTMVIHSSKHAPQRYVTTVRTFRRAFAVAKSVGILTGLEAANCYNDIQTTLHCLLGTQDNAIQRLQDALNDSQKEKIRLESELFTSEKGRLQLQQELSAKAIEMAVLKSETTTLRTKVRTHDDVVAQLKATLDNAEGEVLLWRGKIRSLRQELSSVQGELASYKNRKEEEHAWENTIEELKHEHASQIATLQQECADQWWEGHAAAQRLHKRALVAGGAGVFCLTTLPALAALSLALVHKRKQAPQSVSAVASMQTDQFTALKQAIEAAAERK